MNTGSSDASAICRAAHVRLLTTASGIDNDTIRRPSRLPRWTVGHVLAHLARNADGHVLRLEGALRGEEVARYPGGSDQRDRDIEEGAGHPAAEVVTDLANSVRRLEDAWDRSERAGWPYAHLLAGDHWPTSESPLRRLREVEVHHVDLGLGYEPAHWSDDYVQWELRVSLERLPSRLTPEDSRRFLCWLIGRSEWPEGLEPAPWL